MHLRSQFSFPQDVHLQWSVSAIAFLIFNDVSSKNVFTELNVKHGLSLIYEQVFVEYRDTLKVLIPSALYTVQNNLLYVAISNLNAVAYQILYQSKIFTTALFMVTMLNRKLLSTQWISLSLLCAGIVLSQVSCCQWKSNILKLTFVWLYWVIGCIKIIGLLVKKTDGKFSYVRMRLRRFEYTFEKWNPFHWCILRWGSARELYGRLSQTRPSYQGIQLSPVYWRCAYVLAFVAANIWSLQLSLGRD